MGNRIEFIKSDLMRYCGKTDIITFAKMILMNRTFRFLCVFRLCNTGGGM